MNYDPYEMEFEEYLKFFNDTSVINFYTLLLIQIDLVFNSFLIKKAGIKPAKYRIS